jgi:hypothetical protein
MKRFALNLDLQTGATSTSLLDVQGGKLLRYTDAYVALGSESGGCTIISLVMEGYDPTPLFLMQYEGRELIGDKAIISLLKQALKTNYGLGIFRGGRGPEEYSSPSFPGLIYSNKLEIREGFGGGSDVRWFSSTELIQNHSKRTLFIHNINGKMLVELPAR